MTKTVNEALPHVPFATVGKSTDINWRRWSVMARGIQTEWYKSEAQAIKKADALCKANGSITWTDYTAAKALRARQIEALPELLHACELALPSLPPCDCENMPVSCARCACKTALEKAGVL